MGSDNYHVEKSLSEQNSGWVLPPAIFFVSLTLVMLGMFLYESRSSNSELVDDSGVDGTMGRSKNEERLSQTHRKWWLTSFLSRIK